MVEARMALAQADGVVKMGCVSLNIIETMPSLPPPSIRRAIQPSRALRKNLVPVLGNPDTMLELRR